MNLNVHLLIIVIITTFGADGDDVPVTPTTPSIETVVQIPQGKLEGIQQTARNGRPFAAFLGVPYGKSARFEDSEPADGWNGTRDASKFGENCLQYDSFKKKIVGVEDCLFLNVYTPNLTNESTKTQKLPVMVFIHGGGFHFGSGRDGDGKYFMSEDVVLVFINYRLGPFGFLKTPQGTNFGLKDQVLALKWVQQNIQYFNGERNRVTIFGESAGGASVSLHIVSPLSKGLFHGAISQSGVSTAPFGKSNPVREMKKLGILLDCPTSNQEILIQCLKKIDGNQLMERLTSATKISMSSNKTKEYQPEDIPKFSFSVDSDSAAPVFLPDTPLNLIQKGDFEKVPWISGLNAVEGLVFHWTANFKNVSRKSWNSKDGELLGFDEPDCKDLATIRELYFGSDNNDSIAVSANVTDLFSDRFFNQPAKLASIHYAKHAPAYLYYFSLKGTSSFLGDLNPSDENGLKRPTHMDEMQYQFQVGNFYPEIKADSKFGPFSEFFVKLWVSFAKDGKVSPEKLSPSASAWTPVSSTSGVNDDIEWYQLDKESKMVKESLIFNSRLNFWNDMLGIKFG